MLLILLTLIAIILFTTFGLAFDSQQKNEDSFCMTPLISETHDSPAHSWQLSVPNDSPAHFKQLSIPNDNPVHFKQLSVLMTAASAGLQAYDDRNPIRMTSQHLKPSRR